MTLARSLSFLRGNNLLNSATKDVLGSNLPNMLWVQSKDERVDQAFFQAGHSTLVFAIPLLLQRMIEGIFSAASPGQFNRLTRQFNNPHAQRWFELTKAGALYSFAASFVSAASFLRNWLTLQRTHKVNYADMVGATNTVAEDNPVQIQEHLDEYRKRFLKLWGTGIAAMSGFMILGYGLIHGKVRFPKALGGIEKHLGLPKGDFTQLKDLPTFLFFALPTYLGMWQGARDKLEKTEVMYRMAGFGMAFLVLPRTLEKLVSHALKGKHFPVVGASENAAFLVQLLSGIVFSAALPIGVNLLKRQGRVEEMGLTQLTPPINISYSAQYFGQSMVHASQCFNPFAVFKPAL